MQTYHWIQDQPIPCYEIFNLGSQNPIELTEMVETLAHIAGKKTDLTYLPEQPGDVTITWADIQKAHRYLGFTPKTSFQSGIQSFWKWFEMYEDKSDSTMD